MPFAFERGARRRVGHVQWACRVPDASGVASPADHVACLVPPHLVSEKHPLKWTEQTVAGWPWPFHGDTAAPWPSLVLRALSLSPASATSLSLLPPPTGVDQTPSALTVGRRRRQQVVNQQFPRQGCSPALLLQPGTPAGELAAVSAGRSDTWELCPGEPGSGGALSKRNLLPQARPSTRGSNGRWSGRGEDGEVL